MISIPLVLALLAVPQPPSLPPLQEDNPPSRAEEREVQGPEEDAAPKEEEKARAERSPYLAVVGGEVHTVSRGTLGDAVVLCKGDRILKIGQDVRVPEGARILDARGMKVYPGLIAVSSSGIVSGRGKTLRDSFDPFALNVDLGLAGGLTTVQSGGAVAKLVRGSLEGAVLAQTNWVSLGYSPSSPSGRRKLREGLDRAREFLRAHQRWEQERAAGDQDSEEPSSKGIDSSYLKLLQRRATARLAANSLKDLLAVCDLLEDYPMNAVVFGGQEAWVIADRIGRCGAMLVLVPRAKRWADERLVRPSGWSIENAARLHRAGVSFAILPSQTYISTGGIAGRDLLTLPMEAAFAIRGGLDQEAALRAITLDAARILGVDRRVGSLEVGKDADLIVTDRDLFDYRSFVQWAVVNGKVRYDKQRAPYFAHIRPRPRLDPADLLQELHRAAEAEGTSPAEAKEGGERPTPAPEVDGTENGPPRR